tara:strand:+ start:80 stop:199 length:120 start_codon:yes stop_codon:yes gene_type:complete
MKLGEEELIAEIQVLRRIIKEKTNTIRRLELQITKGEEE